jgi:hypothetical protein
LSAAGPAEGSAFHACDRRALTEEITMMTKQGVSAAWAEASRRNGVMSRGPKTPAGKVRSAQNALKQGLRARKYVVLLGEDGAEFAALEAALIEDLAAVGILQTILARRMARAVEAEPGSVLMFEQRRDRACETAQNGGKRRSEVCPKSSESDAARPPNECMVRPASIIAPSPGFTKLSLARIQTNLSPAEVCTEHPRIQNQPEPRR